MVYLFLNPLHFFVKVINDSGFKTISVISRNKFQVNHKMYYQIIMKKTCLQVSYIITFD